MKPRLSDSRVKKIPLIKSKSVAIQLTMRPPRRNRQPSKKVLHAGAKSSNSRRQTRAEIQRKRRVLNHEEGLDVGQGVDLNTTEMDQMPSTSGINTNINRPSQVMDNAQTSAMHASTSTSQPRQTTVSCTGTSERNTLRQPVPSKRNRAEAIHCSSVMHSGAVSSFGATGPGPSQIPESDDRLLQIHKVELFQLGECMIVHYRAEICLTFRWEYLILFLREFVNR